MNGRVIYRGNSHTTVSGIKRKNIPKERFEKLKSAIESSEFISATRSEGLFLRIHRPFGLKRILEKVFGVGLSILAACQIATLCGPLLN